MNIPLPSLYTIFPVVTIFIQGFLLIKIYNQGLSLRSHKWFFAYLLITICATIANISGTLSANAIDSTFWTLVYFIINVYSFPALLCFTLVYTDHEYLMDRLWKKMLIFAPSYLIMILTLATELVYIKNPAKAQFESLIWQPARGPLYTILYINWITIVEAVSCLLFVSYSHQIFDKKHKTQTMLFALALFLQMLFDLVVTLVVPTILGITLIPDGSFQRTLMGAAIAWGILRYNLFVMSPTNVAKNILSTMAEALIVVTPKGIIEFTNTASQTLLGSKTDRLVGQKLSKILTKDFDRIETNLINPIVQGETRVSMEGSIMDASHKKIPVTFSASPIYDSTSHVIGIVCVITDITHLKQLYNVTAERNKLDAIMESISDGIFSLDATGRIVQINRAGLKLLDTTETMIIGKKIEEIATIENEKNVALTSAELMDIVMDPDKDVPKKNKYVLTTLAGEKRYVRLILSPLQHNPNAPFEAIVTLHDKTDEYQLDEMKVDFVSMAAHELRTPLTAIRGYLSVFISENADKLDTSQKDFLTKIQIAAQRLTTLVENLLSVTRIERKKIILKPSLVDWIPIVENLLQELNPRIKEKNITLTFQKPTEPLPQIEVDTVRISEVVTNLVSNAINYTDPGGSITISVVPDNNGIMTSVKDTGEGISPENQKHLFTKFFRGKGSISQATKGTGLGLFISKSIIEMHHGRIWVESAEKQGSTFSFTLPFKQPLDGPVQSD